VDEGAVEECEKSFILEKNSVLIYSMAAKFLGMPGCGCV